MAVSWEEPEGFQGAELTISQATSGSSEVLSMEERIPPHTMPPRSTCSAILTIDRRRIFTPVGGEINEQYLECLTDQVLQGHIPLMGRTKTLKPSKYTLILQGGS